MAIDVFFENQTFVLEDVLEFPAQYSRELERARQSSG
jgi:hypothetical protein